MDRGDEAGPPSPEPPREGENEVQRNIRLKVCAYCKVPGATKKCNGCRQRTYCNKTCQKRDWKTVHREQCEKLQQVFVPPPAGSREAKAAAERDASGGGGGGAAAAGGGAAGGGAAADDDNEYAHLCPVCLDTEDDAVVYGQCCGQCCAYGQMYCGGCNTDSFAVRSPNCPTCCAPFLVSHEENFKRLWKLVHDRPPGRHTHVAQSNLGTMYAKGDGVKQDHKEAVAWSRRAAEQGHAVAQSNLGTMYTNGHGVKQDHKEAVAWCRKAAEQGVVPAQFNLGVMYFNGNGILQDLAKALKWWQLVAGQGHKGALKNLNTMQQANIIPAPPPGTAVTTILLTSGKAAKRNNKPGIVVAASSAAMIRPGIAYVLLDGEEQPTMLKAMNLIIRETQRM